MAEKTTVTSNVVTVILDNGTQNGAITTVSLSLGKLSATNFDVDKVINVASLLGDCLSKDLYSLEHIQRSNLALE